MFFFGIAGENCLSASPDFPGEHFLLFIVFPVSFSALSAFIFGAAKPS